MKSKVVLINLLAISSSLIGGPPPENKPMAPPPPPPPPPETTVIEQPPLTATTVIVTNRVLTTNAILVTNVTEVTNAVTIYTPAPPSPVFVYDQKLYGGRPVLITPEQAQAIIEHFRTNFPKLACPRVMVFVNRELVDEKSGVRLSARSLKTDQNRGKENSERVFTDNTFRVEDPKDMTLADRQTVRDVERLFGRPLRFGGVSLVDQRVAAQLLGDRPLATYNVLAGGEQARKDREALAKVADVALEVLISSRDITVPEVSGDRTYPVPDIQATAIRLNDSKIIGQATASDLIGKGAYAGRVARSYDVRDIAEATALSLMEDIVTGLSSSLPAPAVAVAPTPAPDAAPAPAPDAAPAPPPPPAVPTPENPSTAK